MLLSHPNFFISRSIRTLDLKRKRFLPVSFHLRIIWTYNQLPHSNSHIHFPTQQHTVTNTHSRQCHTHNRQCHTHSRQCHTHSSHTAHHTRSSTWPDNSDDCKTPIKTCITTMIVSFCWTDQLCFTLMKSSAAFTTSLDRAEKNAHTLDSSCFSNSDPIKSARTDRKAHEKGINYTKMRSWRKWMRSSHTMELICQPSKTAYGCCNHTRRTSKTS